MYFGTCLTVHYFDSKFVVTLHCCLTQGVSTYTSANHRTLIIYVYSYQSFASSTQKALSNLKSNLVYKAKDK